MLFMLFTFYEAIYLNSLKPTYYLVILPLISSRAERTCYLYEAVSPEFWIFGQRFFFSMHSAYGECAISFITDLYNQNGQSNLY